MRHFDFYDNGKHYKQVSKTAARKIFNAGGVVWFCPANLRPFGFWCPAIPVDNKNDPDFEKHVLYFENYNCINSETGKYTRFYIEEA